jgi:multidrug resistance efflux pump
MTWANRLRLWAGILLVVAVTIGLTLVVNQRERQAFSSNATVEAVQYQVGSDYGGIMVDQYVEPDAEVREGEKLFTISSFALQKDLANGLEPVSTSAYDLDAKTGLVTYLASADGTLADFEARQGGYVPGGETMAVITEEDTAYVEAQFRLEPVDYARIQIGSRADVELPNRQVLRGKVSAISVETSDGVAFTTVQIEAPELRADDLSAFAQPGSPVAVTLTLNDDGILAGPTDTLMEFLHRVGVR